MSFLLLLQTSSDEGGSSSSSDFVDLGAKSVSYHHRDKNRSGSASLSSSPRDCSQTLLSRGVKVIESRPSPSRSSSTGECNHVYICSHPIYWSNN